MAHNSLDKPSEDVIHDLNEFVAHVDSLEIRLSDILGLEKADPMQQMRVLHGDKYTGAVVLEAQEPIIPPGTTSPVTVVCKIAYGPDALARLTREYHVYNRLESLQGQDIPRCYGLFYCPAAVDQACLLLEYGGEALRSYDAKDHPSLSAVKMKSWSFRKDLLDILQRIHKLGVNHNHFYESNTIIPKNILIRIIEDKGTPREVPCIINFDKADLAHCCEVEKDVSARSWGFPLHMIHIYNPFCEELVRSANHAIWLPYTIMLQGQPLDAGDVVYMAPKELISKYMKRELSPEAAKNIEESLKGKKEWLLSVFLRDYDWTSREGRIEQYRNIEEELDGRDVDGQCIDGNGFVRYHYD